MMSPIITNEMSQRHMVKRAKLDGDFIGEDSTAHLKSRDDAGSRKTFMSWDMDGCLVPDDLDAGLVVPCIKHLLDKSGFSGGPLTITAVGDLEKQNPDVLRAISSTGVLLKHGSDVLDPLSIWVEHNPPPATIILILRSRYPVSFTNRLQAMGYTILFYPSLREECNEVYTQPPRFCCETGESAWCCMLCEIIINHKLSSAKALLGEDFRGESIEDLTKHLGSRGHKRAELDMGGTQVWWDINSCPVPDDLDPSLVVQSIKGLSEESRISAGLLTITAFGDLEATLKLTPDVLPAISSTGVVLKHAPSGLDLGDELLHLILDDLNPCPTNVVFISSCPDTFSSSILSLKDAEIPFSIYPALKKPEMNWQPSTAWCSENVDSAWCCMLCGHHTPILFRIGESFDGKSIIDDFTKHLESTCHKKSVGGSRSSAYYERRRASEMMRIEDNTCRMCDRLTI